MSNLKDRLKAYINYIKIPISEFENRCGMSNGYVSSIRKGIGTSKLEQVLKAYPQLNREWLLYGEGEMLKSDDKALIPTEISRIPLYNLTASCGILDNIESSEYIEEYLSIPSMPKVDGAIRTAGDSMYPIIKAGDIVFYKMVKDMENIQYGQMYLISVIIEGDHQLMIKYVKKSDRGDDWLLFVSHNPHHEPKDYKKSDIKAIALVKANLRFNVI